MARMTTRLKLPIGIQAFAKLREQGCYYVDKTPYIAQLAQAGGCYFLSRPRRFGKSLFLDTLAEAFAGNRALFDDLYLAENWDWAKKHPIIRVSFGSGRLRDADELDVRIREIMHDWCNDLGVQPAAYLSTIAGLFEGIVKAAHAKYGQRVVILIDEYDKPILDHIADRERASAMREALRNFYSPIKDLDAHLRFVFITGVSKFSKVSIFSGLNNLTDLTLDERYSAICGYTDADIDTVFSPELQGLDRDEIRRWYNGYRWGGPSVYNPFDALLLFDKRKFQSWWFETGTPTFLVQWLKDRQFYTPQLERTLADDDLLGAFDVDDIVPEAMLWQTGYLTLKQHNPTPSGWLYTLGLPNHEVRTALNRALLSAWSPGTRHALQESLPLYDGLASGDSAAVHAHFQRLYASIPHDWYRNNPITQYEGYWASVFYSHLAALGLDIVAEDVSNQGRCDLAIRYQNCVWVIEFKLTAGDTASGAALEQIKAKNYAAKYRAPGTQVIELGIEFSPSQRQIIGWQVA